MKIKIIGATNGMNWGKFLVAQFDVEWSRYSTLAESRLPLLRQCGWGPEHVWVLDLQTGEGAYFRHGGFASADLNKHKIWVCPLFEPFLVWFYKQELDLEKLPALVELPEAEFAFYGYRRSGEADEPVP